MDKMNGIFDSGLSGMFLDHDVDRKTMPDYLAKLAEEEKDYEVPKEEKLEIEFGKNLGLTRASELTSDEERHVSTENIHTKQKRSSEAKQLENIETEFNRLLYKGKNPREIEKILMKKFPRALVQKFVNASVQMTLSKYSHLGFKLVDEFETVNSLAQQSNFKIANDNEAKKILNRFSRLENINEQDIKKYNDLIGKVKSNSLILSFLVNVVEKPKYDEEKEKVAKQNKIEFQRTDDELKTNDVRNLKNQSKRDEKIKKANLHLKMFEQYKIAMKNNDRKTINKKLCDLFGKKETKEFLAEYDSEIKKHARFLRRSNGYSISNLKNETKSKDVVIESRNASVEEMTNFATRKFNDGRTISSIRKSMVNLFGRESIKNFDSKLHKIEKKIGPTKIAYEMLTYGKSIERIEAELRRKYGSSKTQEYMNENKSKLIKLQGQLGYIYLDSNIYENCQGDEMKESYSSIDHPGKFLINAVKANSKCKSCTMNHMGKCGKINLMISNNPYIRSSRAAKRILDKASQFIPKSYIDLYKEKLSVDGGNNKIISEFTLGMKQALLLEQRNIGKQASKDRTQSTEMQEGFIPADSFSVDPFKR